jgi:hypothetical protein
MPLLFATIRGGDAPAEDRCRHRPALGDQVYQLPFKRCCRRDGFRRRGGRLTRACATRERCWMQFHSSFEAALPFWDLRTLYVRVPINRPRP